jgi:hypothetical protein
LLGAIVLLPALAALWVKKAPGAPPAPAASATGS